MNLRLKTFCKHLTLPNFAFEMLLLFCLTFYYSNIFVNFGSKSTYTFSEKNICILVHK